MIIISTLNSISYKYEQWQQYGSHIIITEAEDMTAGFEAVIIINGKYKEMIHDPYWNMYK